jgi:uncharacterized membrane protein
MKLLKHPYNIIYISYVFLSLVLGVTLGNGLIIFLGWNMTLAYFVYILSKGYPWFKSKFPKWTYPLYLGLYILFFPNTIYILTDFIHFQESLFFLNYPGIYYFIISEWLIFAHIVIGALFAAKLGIESIHQMTHHLSITKIKIKYTLLTILFLLSSLGIFIGRFLRFNSWQFIQIFQIISEVFSHFEFAFSFILIFTLIHYLTYFIFSFEDKKHII